MSQVNKIDKKWYTKLYNFANSWTGTVIIVLTIIFFGAQAFIIPSGSMKNTLLIGDNLFVKKFVYGVPTPHIPWLEVPLVPGTDGHIVNGDKPKRGDIVIFRYPLNHKTHYVKRCVGVGGDELFMDNKTLYIHPKEGDAYVKENYAKEDIIAIFDRLWIKNPYRKEHPGIHNDASITPEDGYPPQVFKFMPIRVPENEFFMMGDNRDHSNDSRFWGTVPYGLVEGTPWFIYMSIDDDYSIRWDRVGKTVEELEGK